MISRPDHITSCDNALTALSLLAKPFIDPSVCHDGIEQVEENKLPAIVKRLLVHQNHMTTTLQDHHGEPVELRVLRHHMHEHFYTREILLTLPISNTIVEYGIVRLDLEALSSDVHDEILAKHRPLGEILIAHDVLRRIEPRWMLRLSPQAAIWQNVEFLHSVKSVVSQENFGRIGIIYCHHKPAIELFEVVLNVSPSDNGRHQS